MEGKRSRASERASRAAIEGAQFAASAVEPNFENVKRQKTNGGHEGRKEAQVETEIAIFSTICSMYLQGSVASERRYMIFSHI